MIDETYEKIAMLWLMMCVIVGLSLTGFGIWVILKLLLHFGII